MLLGFAPLLKRTLNLQNALNYATIIFRDELVEIGNILFQLFICDRIRICKMCHDKLETVHVQIIMTFYSGRTTVKMLVTARYDFLHVEYGFEIKIISTTAMRQL